MMGRFSGIAGAVAMLAAVSSTVFAASPAKTVGFVEPVLIQPENIAVRAKVDTGADHSSIDTSDWETFERDGQTWVRFTLRLDGGEQKPMERPLHRMATIIRAGAGDHQRPIILMTLCVGDVAREVQVNLAKRPRLTYRMLLGASFLSGAYLVDVSKTDMTQPSCAGVKP
ncbi:MAG: RimK/LysX family protein [Rhodospirillales bacterium]